MMQRADAGISPSATAMRPLALNEALASSMNCVPSCARLSSPGKVGRNAFGSELRSVVAVAAADMSENRCQSRDGALLRCYHSELLVASSGSESTLSPKSQS